MTYDDLKKYFVDNLDNLPTTIEAKHIKVNDLRNAVTICINAIETIKRNAPETLRTSSVSRSSKARLKTFYDILNK